MTRFERLPRLPADIAETAEIAENAHIAMSAQIAESVAEDCRGYRFCRQCRPRMGDKMTTLKR